jgi:hypothetical protein
MTTDIKHKTEQTASAHTPAPWGIERSKDGADSWYLYGQFAESPIAEIACWLDDYESGVFQSAESEANCRLIVASPRLLEVAEEAASEPCSASGVQDLEPGCCKSCRARSVVTEAKGLAA